MSQNKDLSTLTPVIPDPGKYQWVRGESTGIDDEQEDRTHTVGVPHQMPGVIICVHGVNSDGEWYFDASKQFAKGLNERLGRDDLRRLEKDTEGDKDKATAHRYLKVRDGQRIPSPIIPFWWGYKVPAADRKMIAGSDKDKGHTPAWTDQHGNPLRTDGAWGGGPFQNGGGALNMIWLPTGFCKHILGGVIDLNVINPILGRELCDCGPRLYYAHAARRLANLVRDIRENLPNEPINIVSHSQGTMVTLCSLFYLAADKVRPPDTVMLNSSPYRFDTQITDYLTAADGWGSVQSEDGRIATFAEAAKIVAGAAKNYPAPPEPKADCTIEHKPRHSYDDGLYVCKPADTKQWEAEIGGKVEDPSAGRGSDDVPWWTLPKFARVDTRGKLMVNFNPADRVIGVSAVAGIGWRGISPKHMAEVGDNVQQRLFARGTNPEHNPPVGSDPTDKELKYFYKQIVHVPANERHGAYDTEEWRYLDGSQPNREWKIPSEKILGVKAAMGDLEPSMLGHVEGVTVNAPTVPKPLTLPEDFDGDYVMYNGQAGTDPDGKQVRANREQQEDFEDDITYQERQTAMQHDEQGRPTTTRYETWEEVEKRRQNKVGHVPVSPTNHAAILRYVNTSDDGDGESSPVANVLSYDLTVGQGYAWHDEDYWSYLLDLADWKKSDPYYKDTDKGGMDGKLPESDKTPPPGIVGAQEAAAMRPTPEPQHGGPAMGGQ